MKEPLLTVIVPVYNVEKYVEKCIFSLQEQSYKNIEIICVDDASPDGSLQIIKRLADKDSRIRIIQHKENLGLFQARKTGIEQARGEIIAFVDSDDFVSSDWFRPLVKVLVDDGAEMVLGNTVNVDESGNKTYFNRYRSFNMNRKPLVGKELLYSFFRQQGECFIWHTVWNKIYSKTLLERCLPYLEKIKCRLIMGEDILFSTVFYAFAEKLSFCDNDCYFYFRHSQASTSIFQSKNKLLGYVQDICNVFLYAKDFLTQIGRFSEVENNFNIFKEKYFRIWSGNIRAAGYANDKEVVGCLLSGFGKESLSELRTEEFYFYEQTTEWDEKYEELRYKIQRKEIEVVSFDLFDTLILRPFWTPDDLFNFVADKIENIVTEPDTFTAMRKEAEDKCRLFTRMMNSKAEDITLRDIYNFFSKLFGFTEREVCMMMNAEIEAELNFCYPRRAGITLFELAKAAGKRVVLTSDIYMEKPLIEKILEKCGISGYDKLYLSSEYKKLKMSGELFNIVKCEEGKPSKTFLHIGDNWKSDIEAAEKEGMKALFFPKAVETYTNNISNVYTGDAFKEIYLGAHENYDSRCVMEQLPLRCLYACVANGFFDNPFRSFHSGSYYNADAYYIGYSTLGMHILGLAKFIGDAALRCGYKKIVFLARDGYVVKKVFDMLYSDRGICSSYLETNRKILLPFAIKTKQDLLGLYRFFDLSNSTPKQVLKILEPLWGELTEDQAVLFHKHGIDLQRPFMTRALYFDFARAAYEIMGENPRGGKEIEKVRASLAKEFTEKCACFDIGYSGRLQAILCDIAGKPIDVFYIHDNGCRAERVAAKNGFRIFNFYEYTPNITSVLREYLISDTKRACHGYKVVKGKIQYKFDEEDEPNYAETYAVREMQRGAIDYCSYILEHFGDQLDKFFVRPQDISIAFENFLWNAKDFDRKAFINSYLEDEVHSGYSKENYYEIWNWHLSQLKKNIIDVDGDSVRGRSRYDGYDFLKGRSRFWKGMFYLIFDRKKLYAKYKEYKQIRKLKRGL